MQEYTLRPDARQKRMALLLMQILTSGRAGSMRTLWLLLTTMTSQGHIGETWKQRHNTSGRNSVDNKRKSSEEKNPKSWTCYMNMIRDTRSL